MGYDYFKYISFSIFLKITKYEYVVSILCIFKNIRLKKKCSSKFNNL